MILKFASAISLLLSVAVDAYFYVPSFRTNLPFKGGMATATRNNNTLIMFGGECPRNSYTNDLYQLSQVSNTFDWQILQQNNPPPGTLYGQVVITNNNNDMYLLGGMTNETSVLNVPLQNYRFSFASNTWSASTNNKAAISNTTVLPRNRKLFSATYDNQNKVYIYGGALNNTEVFGDFYSLDLTTQQYTALPNPSVLRYGHTGSLLGDGRLVFIGGILVNDSSSWLASMDIVHVFDPHTNQWGVEKASFSDSRIPSTRNAHSAVVTWDDRIVVFGGDSGEGVRNRRFLNSIAILDTKNWTWVVPAVDGILPSRRSYASVGLLNGSLLTVAFGTGSNTFYNDINVMNLSTYNWIQSFTPETNYSGVSSGLIAGVTVICVALLIFILFLLWKFQRYVKWTFTRVHREVWKPRTGEPLWAETTRLSSQIFLAFVFCALIAFVLRQTIESPNITQTFQESLTIVEVPDIRFCFDGFPSYTNATLGDPRRTGVSCFVDTGYSCSGFIQTLNMSVLQPFYNNDNKVGSVNCYMFRAPSNFALDPVSNVGNGSKLIFTMYGDQTVNNGRIHISVYAKQMNPNVATYSIDDSIPLLISESAVLNWQSAERADMQQSNVFTVQPFTSSFLTYNMIENQYLENVGWNYVGFLPTINPTPDVEVFFRQDYPNTNYANTQEDLGTIVVSPATLAKFVRREVKMYTLVNALGFVGGIFGLIVALQACVFGVRPKSPWGVLQRWSVGNMKRSLYQNLRSEFKISESGVPLIDPLHHRLDATNVGNLNYEKFEVQQINYLQERVQMLEILLKSYYVDDEVFRSLSDAYKAQGPSSLGNVNDSAIFPSSSFSNAPRTEEITDGIFPVGSTSKCNPQYHPLNRNSTDQSSTSSIPLTETHYKH